MKILYQDTQIITLNGLLSHHDAVQLVQDTLSTPVNSEDVTVQPETKSEVTQAIRNTINNEAGDIPSILGTTADATQLLLCAFFELITQLHTAKTLADVRAAAAPYNDLGTRFLEKVNTGEVKLPYQLKGIEAVVNEIETRATGVSTAIEKTTRV